MSAAWSSVAIGSGVRMVSVAITGFGVMIVSRIGGETGSDTGVGSGRVIGSGFGTGVGVVIGGGAAGIGFGVSAIGLLVTPSSLPTENWLPPTAFKIAFPAPSHKTMVGHLPATIAETAE